MLFHQKLCTHKGTSCIPFGIFIKFEKNVPQNAIPTIQHYIRTPCPIFDTYLSLPFHCIFNNFAMFMKKLFYKLCRVNKHVATILKNFDTYLPLPFHCIFNYLAMFMKKFIWGFYKLCRVNKHVATILKNFSTDYCYCIYFPSFMQIYLQLSNYQLLRKLFKLIVKLLLWKHICTQDGGIMVGWKFV